MGLLALFEKTEAQCEKCQAIFPIEQLNQFDSTIRDEKDGGEYKSVCRNCLMDEFYNTLKNFTFRAIMIQPLKKLNGMAYQYYPFQEMPEYEWTKEQIEDFKKFLPPEDAHCKECSEKAQYNWCSPDIYFHDIFSQKINTTGEFSQEFLCSECLFKKFKELIEKEDIYFHTEFFPPYDGDGLGTSFEA